MAIHVNDAGTWKEVSTPHVNDAGTWKTPQEVFVNDAGTWNSVWPTIARFSIGTFFTSDVDPNCNTFGSFTYGTNWDAATNEAMITKSDAWDSSTGVTLLFEFNNLLPDDGSQTWTYSFSLAAGPNAHGTNGTPDNAPYFQVDVQGDGINTGSRSISGWFFDNGGFDGSLSNNSGVPETHDHLEVGFRLDPGTSTCEYRIRTSSDGSSWTTRTNWTSASAGFATDTLNSTDKLMFIGSMSGKTYFDGFNLSVQDF